MSGRSLYLAAYDISDPKRLRLAFEILKDYSTGGQKSVFECFLTPGEKAELLARILQIIDTSADRFLLIRLGSTSSMIPLGIARRPSNGNFFYIG
jgi:CRISPR-associated protein Cas2